MLHKDWGSTGLSISRGRVFEKARVQEQRLQGASKVVQCGGLTRLSHSHVYQIKTSQYSCMKKYSFFKREYCTGKHTTHSLRQPPAFSLSRAFAVFIREIDSVSSSTQISAFTAIPRGSNFNSAHRHSLRLAASEKESFRILCIYKEGAELGLGKKTLFSVCQTWIANTARVWVE